MAKTETVVIIIGAGPAGLAVAACLSVLSVPFVILEKDDCTASLWRKHTYDRLKLHLAKSFCALPHMPHATSAPTFIPKGQFLQYLDKYAARFGLRPEIRTAVESAIYDAEAGMWVVAARDGATGEAKTYEARFLVAATGENGEAFVPEIPGLESFTGKVVHSSEYKSGAPYESSRVIVVGCGNSGMEIAYDLATFGARPAITIRKPFHVVTKKMIHVGMVLLKHGIPMSVVDALVLAMAKLKYGDLSKYGILRPKSGPFLTKERTGRSPVIDVGTIKAIKAKQIQVVPGITRITGQKVEFSISDDESDYFDAIVFATGYKSSLHKLMDKGDLVDEQGLPRERFPNHWKGRNGAYFAGFSKRGLLGISLDAQKIANEIYIKLSSLGKIFNL